MDNGLILTTANQPLTVTNYLTSSSTNDVGSLPVGAVGDSATGELGLKVIVIGSGGGATGVVVQGNTKNATSTYSPTRDTSLATVTKKNIKASGGNVFSITADNANAATRYLLIHNKATAPAAADVPTFFFRIPASGQIIIGSDFFTNDGANLATGIGWAISTTRDTFTDSATAADHSVTIHYA